MPTVAAHLDPPDPRAATDPELLARVAQGDPVALGGVYDRYARDVWMAVRRVVGDPSDADDVVQTVFLKLPAIAPSYDGRASCRGWLRAIGVRTALRHRRGFARFRRMLAAFSLAPSGPARDPERDAAGQEQLEVLERAVAKLSDKKRAVFLMVEVDGLSAEEAARVLEVPAATVRTRLFHARHELQAALSRGA